METATGTMLLHDEAHADPKQRGWTSMWTYSGDPRLRRLGMDARGGCIISGYGAECIRLGPRGSLTTFSGDK